MRQQPPPPSLAEVDVTGTPHAQFLATEHWSLLATHSMTVIVGTLGYRQVRHVSRTYQPRFPS